MVVVIVVGTVVLMMTIVIMILMLRSEVVEDMIASLMAVILFWGVPYYKYSIVGPKTLF